MTAAVLKWPVPVDGERHAVGGGRVVLVDYQVIVRHVEESLCVWTLEQSDADAISREVIVVGTGQELPPGDWHHIGSCIAGSFVWHVFEDGVTA